MTQAPLFRNGDTVLLRSNRALVGKVTREPELDGREYWYRVKFAKRVEIVVEDDLELLEEDDDSVESLVNQGRWGRIQSFRCALAVERITQTNRSTVYSFKAQRILFEPYQYKPLYEAVRRDQDKEGVLNAHSIYYILGGEHSIPAIEATIAMLQSDLIGALATNDNGSLYTRLSPRMLNDKLTQLKDKIGGDGGS